MKIQFLITLAVLRTDLTLTRDKHQPGHQQKHDTVKRNTLLEDYNEDFSIHDYRIEQTRPHEEQTGQEIPVVAEPDALAEKHAVVITAQDTHVTVVAV